jgi:hypothetical protein
MSTINSSERMAGTLYCLGPLFVSEICIKIPCINEIIIIIIIIIITLLSSVLISMYYPFHFFPSLVPQTKVTNSHIFL